MMKHPTCFPSAVPEMYSKEEKKKEEKKDNCHEDEQLKELEYNGFWAAMISLLCYLYGNLTVARQLPPDPRQDKWIMMWSAVPTLLISFGYVFCSTWLGPHLMKNREPVKGLRSLMMLYNAVQVVFSGWMFYEGAVGGWLTRYSFLCQPCEFTNEPNPIRMLHGGYWYYFSKFVDFIDTAFFVLHKKYEHISLLHVSHHALMPVSVWYGIRYQPGGHASLMGFINSFVHTVMYTYYLLAAMGPRMRPFLWWKKYLTTMQMLQFTIVFFHALAVYVVKDCQTPLVLVHWVGFMAVVFFVLFADFYIKAYRKKRLSGGRRGRITPNTEGVVNTKLSSRNLQVRSRYSASNGVAASSAFTEDVVILRHSLNRGFS